METRGGKSDDTRKPQLEQQRHPQEWERDLSPDRLAGQNIGAASSEREMQLPTAYEIKALHYALNEFADDELRQIPILREGMRLQQGATYVDLRDSRRRAFTGTGDMRVGAGSAYVPKDRVPYPLWNRLIGGEEKPAR